ncbi:MAG TPA: signal peptidase I [Dehalococcoidia bacterium]|nr:signal peptidase I [Dehalococcoidia bacterium]
MSNDPAGPDQTPGLPGPDTSEHAASPAPADGASHGHVFASTPSAEAAAPAVPVDGHMAAPPPPLDARPPDDYGDVPASLELAYTSADLGLSPAAYEQAFPYENVARRRRNRGERARRVARELAETVILALLIFFAVKAVVQNFRVEGASMEPSLQTNQYLLVNKAIYFRVNMDRIHKFLPFIPGDNGHPRYLFRAPRRGDVIVFKFPLDTSRDFIKRVIGVPGDTVEVKNETVYINGSPLKENYIAQTPNYTYGPKTVPPGMYFVLGDNRRFSYDSHSWTCPQQQVCDFVPESDIIGQAWFRYWPLDVMGFVDNKIIRPIAP